MELNRKLLAEITEIFRRVDYGRITFHLNPENKTFNYTVETTHKIPMEAIGTPAADDLSEGIVRRPRSGLEK